jgi:hypothetical protein
MVSALSWEMVRQAGAKFGVSWDWSIPKAQNLPNIVVRWRRCLPRAPPNAWCVWCWKVWETVGVHARFLTSGRTNVLRHLVSDWGKLQYCIFDKDKNEQTWMSSRKQSSIRSGHLSRKMKSCSCGNKQPIKIGGSPMIELTVRIWPWEWRIRDWWQGNTLQVCFWYIVTHRKVPLWCCTMAKQVRES